MSDSSHPMLPADAEALARAAERLGLRLVVRFGSRADGAVPPPTRESDLDLAVLADPARRVSPLDVAAALGDVFPGVELDVVLLNDADPVLLDEVFRRADLLAGDPDLFAEWQAYAFRSFTDSADLRAVEAALSRRKLDRLLHAAA